MGIFSNKANRAMNKLSLKSAGRKIAASQKLRALSQKRARQAVLLDRRGDIYGDMLEGYRHMLGRFMEVGQGLEGEVRSLGAQVRSEVRTIQQKRAEERRLLGMMGRLRQALGQGVRKRMAIERVEQRARAQAAVLANMATSAKQNAFGRMGNLSVNAQRALAKK